MSVWFNVRLTVIGFWCLPLITSENWGGQFMLWMHIKPHQKLRSWRPGNIIKAFYNATLCVIGYALFVCVCVRMIEGILILAVFWVFRLTWPTLTYCRAISNAPLFLPTASCEASLTHTLGCGQFVSEWWKCRLYVVFEFPSLMPTACICHVRILHNKQPSSSKCSLTQMLVCCFDKENL